VSLDSGYVLHAVRETSRSARFDTDDPAVAATGSLVRSLGVRSAVASPILVAGELWRAIRAASLEGARWPRRGAAAHGVHGARGNGVANTQSREEATALAGEQAALRVATLVAQSVPAPDVFSAVSTEVARLFGTTTAAVARFDPEAAAVVIVGVAARTKARRRAAG
jgi:hypothetical protein